MIARRQAVRGVCDPTVRHPLQLSHHFQRLQEVNAIQSKKKTGGNKAIVKSMQPKKERKKERRENNAIKERGKSTYAIIYKELEG